MAGHSRPKDGVASARLCPGHLRLDAQRKTWMPATSAGMTWRDCRPVLDCPMNSPATAKTKRRGVARSRPPGAAARMVRPSSAPAAVAAVAGRAGRSVPGLAVGDHAAADRRQNGRAVFREISGALAGCRRIGRCIAGRSCPLSSVDERIAFIVVNVLLRS